MIVSAISGKRSTPTGANDSDRGAIFAITKNDCPATHNDSEHWAVLKATRIHECFRRSDEAKLSIATASVAGAGPNSSVEVMKNVSVTEIVARVAAIFIVK